MAPTILSEPVSSGNHVIPFTTLRFHDHDVPVYDVEGRPHLAGPDLAKLLGYRSVRSVNTIHARHADELDPHARLITLMCRDGKPRETRAYDEPGSYLLTMFATTENAKPVRLWLANLPRRTRELAATAATSITPGRPTTAKERNALTTLINRYVGLLPGSPNQEAYKSAWRKVHDVMGIKGIEELTVEQLPRAVVFVQSLIDALALPQGDAPKALPVVTPPLSTIRDYASIFQSLPKDMRYWRDLTNRLGDASDRFRAELRAIEKDAMRPFKEDRRVGIATFLDCATLDAYKQLFRIAEQGQQTAFMGVYGALSGLENLHDLLLRG
ncbi:hypothetical protein K9F62_02980 [Desulfovibrio sp. JY]|nr:hypothetical protein K9F62_02980 [Desulfovibrio sp. JY]